MLLVRPSPSIVVGSGKWMITLRRISQSNFKFVRDGKTCDHVLMH